MTSDFRPLLKQALLDIRELQAKLEAGERARSEAIAIIGIGCRFPGGANAPDEYWRLLENGVDAICEVPGDRWDASAFYDPTPGTPGKMRTRWGGFLSEVDRFDAAFFGIAPREAAHMDPQQRLWLEVAWEAIEDAGQPAERVAGSRTGVFVAICASDYMRLALSDPDSVDPYDAAGGAESIVANRLSYLLDLQGPSVAVDTACSSSLVAVHLACQSLRSRECDMAVAGGVNLILTPEITISLSSAGMLASDGRCKTFDARADGYVRGEGCGAVVLKRLSDAIAAGDSIHAVIRGSAVNQDGRSNGLTAPNVRAQQAVLRQALTNAGVEPARVGYIETHGTGTVLGDPIEVEALTAVYGQPRGQAAWCALGAVKANLGHLEGAAGIAGLMKAALALEHGAIPPQLHFRTLNPNIDLKNTPFVIPTHVQPWPRAAAPRAAAVSSFGFGGTNAHIVLEEAPPQTGHTAAPARTVYLLPLSARHPEALSELIDAYQNSPSLRSVSELCYSAAVRRSHHHFRLAVVADSAIELREQLARLNGSADTASRLSPSLRPQLVYVFSGHGSQWAGMGKELLAEEPVFRAVLEECGTWILKHGGWVLQDELFAEPQHSRLAETEIAQAAIVAVQIALAALWRSWGIQPAAVVGHSIGEVAAAQVAGALSIADAMRIACLRGRLMQPGHGQGAMAAVALGAEAAEEAVAGYGGRLAVAAINSPVSTVLSGDSGALADILNALETQGVRCKRLEMPYAFHSPQMAKASEALVQELAGLAPVAGTIPILSTLTGRIASGETFDANYWGRQLRQPVLFAAAMAATSEEQPCTFLEIGGHPVLVGAIAECRRTAFGSLRRDKGERRALLETLGRLYSRGHDVDWSALYPQGGRGIPLPRYPWQRTRYWLEPRPPRQSTAARGGHPLRGRPLHSPAIVQSVFELPLSTAAIPFLSDHRIHGTVVVPAVAYLEMVLAVLPDGLWDIGDIVLQEALTLFPEDAVRTVQVAVTSLDSFQVFSRGSEDPPDWRLHASGKISGQTAAPMQTSLATLRTEFVDEMSKQDFYQAAQARGFEFGARFQGINRIWRGDGQALAEIRCPEGAISEAAPYRIHPALVDAGLQVVMAALPASSALYVPFGVDSFRQYARPGVRFWSSARMRAGQDPGAETLVADVVLFDEEGNALAEVQGLRIKRATREALDHASNHWLHELVWRQRERGSRRSRTTEREGSAWLILADQRGVGAALYELLKARGQDAVLVYEPQQLREALDSGRYWRGAIHLWSLDEEPLTALMERCCGSALDLVRAGTAPLWLVTQGAQAADQQLAPLPVAQAPLWGAGRVIALEHPELWGGLIDLPPSLPHDATGLLLDEICESDGEDQIAFRDGKRYVARLIQLVQRVHRSPPAISWKPDATYLITGGLGALGLQVARRLIEQGARHVVLAGRSAASAAARVAISEMIDAGADVAVMAADVSQEGDVERLLRDIANTMPPLRGIIHAAGILDDGILLRQDWKRFAAVLAPKALGAWHLHCLTRDLSLDCFVMFSSAVSLLGSPGQASYAAANAFLDALAHLRRAHGLAALTINWGPWAAIGMAASDGERKRRWNAQGIDLIELPQGMQAFARALQQDSAQVAVLPVRWARYLESSGDKPIPPLLSELARAPKAAASRNLLAELAKASADDKWDVLREHVRQQVCGVLAVERSSGPDLERGFAQMGMDSLMAVELRNALQHSLGSALPATLAFDYPSVEKLTRYLGEQVLSFERAAERPVEDLLQAMQNLSAEELERL